VTWFDGWNSVGRVAVTAVLAYAALLFFLHVQVISLCAELGHATRHVECPFGLRVTGCKIRSNAKTGSSNH
jgi:hypothetical protein